MTNKMDALYRDEMRRIEAMPDDPVADLLSAQNFVLAHLGSDIRPINPDAVATSQHLPRTVLAAQHQGNCADRGPRPEPLPDISERVRATPGLAALLMATLALNATLVERNAREARK